VNSHLRVLVAQKELRERRRLSILTIAKESGANRATVERLLNNSIKEVPLDGLGRICAWVPCEPGDILKFEEVPS
jgi:putative transcriptional regulator